MPEISIIVPVYNVEKYLEKCIESILSQTFQNFELILVDDGSTDKSGIICEQYKEKDSRITVIHKKNGGLSSARNAGIKSAKGKFLGFVDSDDYIDSDMYETLYDLIVENDADISMCQFYEVYKNKIVTPFIKKEVFLLTAEQAIKTVMEAKFATVSANTKLYKKQLFDSIQYPDGKVYEDAYVIVDILKQCHLCVITTDAKYYYVHRAESIMTTHVSQKDMHMIYAYKYNLELISHLFPKIKDSAYYRLILAHLYLLDRLLVDENRKNEMYFYLKKGIKDSIKFIIRCPLFSFKRKLSIILLLLPIFGETIYTYLMKPKRNSLIS